MSDYKDSARSGDCDPTGERLFPWIAHEKIVREYEQEANDLIKTTVIITSELYRPILIKIMLSRNEVDTLLVSLATLAHGFIISNKREDVIEAAKKLLFEVYHIKL